MKKLLLLLPFFLAAQMLHAQFGLSLAYKPIQAKNWERVVAQHQNNVPNAELFANGFHVGVDYWFRLKKYRVEFVPELSYTYFSRFWQKELGEIVEENLKSQFVSLHFNTNFYVFNLKGDCDCPTFSKEGNSLEKGFFIQLSPGVNYVSNTFKQKEISETATDIVPSIGIGVGIDFGINDLVTITPMVKIHRYFGVEWDGLNTYFETEQLSISPELNKNDVTQIFAGVRVGLRLDAKKY